jgi:predicted peptidase
MGQRGRWVVGIGFIGLVVAAIIQATKPIKKPDNFTDHTFRSAAGNDYPYCLYIPPGYPSQPSYPLIVFLHGYSDRGTDGRKMIKVGLGPSIQYDLNHPGLFPEPFLALFPQSRSGSWSPDTRDGDLVLYQIKEVVSRYQIDPNRIYLTGHSSGGAGTWELAAANPDLFAAIVPVCAGTDINLAKKLVHIPCWCFHGGSDHVTPASAARDMIKALKEVGGKPKYTEYKGLDHNIWRKVYTDRELMNWLFRQSK